MTEEQKDDNESGNHYSEFSKDEFKPPLTIGRLCEVIKADDYGIKFNSSDNSINRLNELLEHPEFYHKLVQKKGNLNWSLDVRSFLYKLSPDGEYNTYPSGKSNNKPLYSKRLNRLLLEEAYPRETPKSSKFFIPPGLMGAVDTFEDHYKVANGEPILIIGQTGVGKSLFLHIFERLYREEHKDKKRHPIIKVNCAHFGGDPNLVRSELFGHRKGAFTGALNNKKGFVEIANGGVLILEEIGDLPPDTQAALLTFIETGEYYPVGFDIEQNNKPKDKKERENPLPSTESVMFSAEYPLEYDNKQKTLEPKSANVRVVGLTNRDKKMRKDLKYRFFPFYVPPIHKRREDILYYLCAMFPDLFYSLKPYEILTLLTYNWPGNVREIEKVGRLLCRKNESIKKLDQISASERDRRESYRLYNLDPNSTDTSVDARQVQNLLNDLIKNNVDVKFLESLFDPYPIGLMENRKKLQNKGLKGVPFLEQPSDRFNCIYNEDISIRYGLRNTLLDNHFFDALVGLKVFCELFYQDVTGNFNLLDLKKHFVFNYLDEILEHPKDEDKFQKLTNSIFEYLSGIKLNGIINIYLIDPVDEQRLRTVVYDPTARKDCFTVLGKLHPENHFLTSIGFIELAKKEEIEGFDICSFRVNDLLELYYQKILDRAAGNKSRAAELAGIPPTTFSFDFNKYVRKVSKKRATTLKTS
jgi:transcriptional regulator with AAA-type ATPase domain